MKTNWQLFGGLSVFYVLMAIVYYYVGGEAVGITGMILAACLAGMVGFYSAAKMEGAVSGCGTTAGGPARSAMEIPVKARRIASFTGSQRPRTGQESSESQTPKELSTQAVSAIGPSMAVITSISGISARGLVSR